MATKKPEQEVFDPKFGDEISVAATVVEVVRGGRVGKKQYEDRYILRIEGLGYFINLPYSKLLAAQK